MRAGRLPQNWTEETPRTLSGIKRELIIQQQNYYIALLYPGDGCNITAKSAHYQNDKSQWSEGILVRSLIIIHRLADYSVIGGLVS